MGFMDKAKKMAEQAQQKLDDVQKQFSEGEREAPAGAPGGARYDEHGRPIGAESPPAADPAVAQGVGQPQPPEAADALGEPRRGEEEAPADEAPPPPPDAGGANASPDPFKPLQ